MDTVDDKMDTGVSSQPGATTLLLSLPVGVWNMFALLILSVLLVWITKLFKKVIKTIEVKEKLMAFDNRVLQLHGMSIYQWDLNHLIKAHFNQILRIRRTVPCVPIERWISGGHAKAESFKLEIIKNPTTATTSSATVSIRLNQTFDMEFRFSAELSQVYCQNATLMSDHQRIDLNASLISDHQRIDLNDQDSGLKDSRLNSNVSSPSNSKTKNGVNRTSDSIPSNKGNAESDKEGAIYSFQLLLGLKSTDVNNLLSPNGSTKALYKSNIMFLNKQQALSLFSQNPARNDTNQNQKDSNFTTSGPNNNISTTKQFTLQVKNVDLTKVQKRVCHGVLVVNMLCPQNVGLLKSKCIKDSCTEISVLKIATGAVVTVESLNQYVVDREANLVTPSTGTGTGTGDGSNSASTGTGATGSGGSVRTPNFSAGVSRPGGLYGFYNQNIASGDDGVSTAAGTTISTGTSTTAAAGSTLNSRTIALLDDQQMTLLSSNNNATIPTNNSIPTVDSASSLSDVVSNSAISNVSTPSATTSSVPGQILKRNCCDLQSIYGFEDQGDRDCMICYERVKNVLLIPCRHCSICHVCLRSLREEKCPICRAVFERYITFPPPKNGSNEEDELSSPGLPPPSPSHNINGNFQNINNNRNNNSVEGNGRNNNGTNNFNNQRESDRTPEPTGPGRQHSVNQSANSSNLSTNAVTGSTNSNPHTSNGNTVTNPVILSSNQDKRNSKIEDNGTKHLSNGSASTAPKFKSSTIIQQVSPRELQEITQLSLSKDGGTGASDNGDSPCYDYSRKDELREQKSGLLGDNKARSKEMRNVPAE